MRHLAVFMGKLLSQCNSHTDLKDLVVKWHVMELDMLVLLCIFRLILEKFGMGLAVCQISLTVLN